MHRTTLCLLATLTLGASANAQGARRPTPRRATLRARPGAADDTAAWNAFNRSIDSAKTYNLRNVRPLLPLPLFGPDIILGVTLTGDTLETRDTTNGIWITGPTEIRRLCETIGADSLLVYLRRVLGMKPTSRVDFAQLIEARARDVFRPAPNEVLRDTLPCRVPAGGGLPPRCGAEWPDTANRDYRWLVSQGSFKYQPDVSYPFTDLGYTYNWNPGADRYGASEYVIRHGAPRTIVHTWRTAAFCAR
jgi:hypothetical protein